MTVAITLKRLMQACCLLLLAPLAVSVGAQPLPMSAGTHYQAIEPAVATSTNADTIEVLDVFWYGCPVCAQFEPMMSYYGGEIRGDVALARMPAIWNPLMRTHAQVYYTAVQLQIADQAHPAAFHYIYDQQQPITNADQARTFFDTLGVAADAFAQAWNSPEVSAALTQAEQKTAAAGITHLPALVVNGRYRVVRNEGVPELPQVVMTANQLIRMLRDERRSG